MSDSKNVEIHCWMAVGYATNTDYDEVIDTGFTRAEWDAKSADERAKICEEIREEFVWAQINGGWKVVE